MQSSPSHQFTVTSTGSGGWYTTETQAQEYLLADHRTGCTDPVFPRPHELYVRYTSWKPIHAAQRSATVLSRTEHRLLPAAPDLLLCPAGVDTHHARFDAIIRRSPDAVALTGAGARGLHATPCPLTGSGGPRADTARCATLSYATGIPFLLLFSSVQCPVGCPPSEGEWCR